MGRQAKTAERLQIALEVLSAHHPMTVRQVYYQLVSRQVVENKLTMYQAISDLLVKARKEGIIPWDWIEDRLRRPRSVSMWGDLSDFARTAEQAYRRDVWATQPSYLEVWLEKDALSGIFEDALRPYGVTLNVGRGFDGWTSIKDAAYRFYDRNGATVLYFGDFDPSGEDMVRSLTERINYFYSESDYVPVKLIKCALTKEDIRRYRLPPALAKRTDSRAAKFIAQHGDISVELDALTTNVLRRRLVTEVEKHMDLQALKSVRDQEALERERLVSLLSAA
jgi:hypothetical protein